MKNLMQYVNECYAELDSIHIPYRKAKFSINTRAKHRWGNCKMRYDCYEISISETLLQDDSSIDGLKNTIIHELLHTCPACMNHGYMWKLYADKVNRKFGYNIKRTSSAEEKGVSEVRIAERTASHKYSFECKKCGTKVYKDRMCGIVRNPSNYSHVGCGGNFVAVSI